MLVCRRQYYTRDGPRRKVDRNLPVKKAEEEKRKVEACD
jgi:hypothetical protein